MTKNTNRLRCFLIGETSLLIQCAQQLIERQFNILGIISPDLLVTKWANARNIAISHPSDNFLDTLTNTPFDYLFSIINSAILPDDVLTLPARYAINYHDGPLPKYAGLNATTWALINRETRHAITWHVMTKQVDAGDILKQVPVEIAPDDTSLTLNAKCYQAASAAFAELIEELAVEKETRTPQNLSDRTYFGITKRPPAAGVISWEKSPQEIEALIRALDFGAYLNPLATAKLFMGTDFLTVGRAKILTQESPLPAGSLAGYDDESLIVSTTGANLALSHFSTLNGQPLTTAAIVTAFDLSIGDRLAELPATTALQLEKQAAALAKYEPFWAERLTSLQAVRLPYAHLSHANQTSFTTIRAALPNVDTLTDTHSGSTYAIIVAAFAAYLARLNDTGFVQNNSSDKSLSFDIGLQNTITDNDFFESCLPCRIEIDVTQSFTAIFTSIREQLSQTQQHQTFTRDIAMRYPELIALSHTGEVNFSPIALYPTTVCRIDSLDSLPAEAHEFTLLIPTPDTRQIGFRYQQQIFDHETAARVMAQFLHFLHGIITQPERPLYQHSLLPDAERCQLLIDWNDTAADYSYNKCIHHLIEEQVERTPGDIALVFEDRQLTYRQLNARANQLAHYLRSQGVEPGTVVGICAEYSVEMVVGLLGILKSGGAYTPLDPRYPTERLATMITDVQMPVLLTQSHLISQLPQGNAQIIVLDQAGHLLDPQPTHNPSSETGKNILTADDLIYVLFTSGSTGKPKGAGVYHRSFTNLVQWFISDLGLTAQDRVLLISSLGFDLTQKNIYAPLICGGTLHLIEMPVFDPHQIGRTIEHHTISWVNCTPSAFYAVVDNTTASLSSLRYVILGGEPIAVPRLINWLSKPDIDAKIVNTYGPTECTDICAFHIVDAPTRFMNQSVPLGRPIHNVKLYILDQHLQPVPIGGVGELCITGAGVGQGYINDPVMTNDKFIPNPFTDFGFPIADFGLSDCTSNPKPKIQNPKLYKTGDLARYLPNGAIEFLGRVDHQVKIRGFRVELGDIESTLNRHPDVQEAAVVAHQTASGDKRLAAYIVSAKQASKGAETQRNTLQPLAANHQLLITNLRQYLQHRLPDHMIPSVFVLLPALPLTPNGKVDRQALPEPPRQAPSAINYAAPQSGLQKQLVSIWQEELQLDQIGIDDNFFELGGHSLLLLNIHRQLQQILEQNEAEREITVVDLFRYPTIRALGQHLEPPPPTASPDKKAQRLRVSQTGVEIAVVGMAGRFPGAPSVEAFWQNLCEGRESISFFSDEELLAAGVEPELLSQPNYVKAGGVLSNIEWFDADFFGLSAQEAEVLDPQIRLFMECAWEALEHAGCNPQTFLGDIGVYAGAGMNTYLSRLSSHTNNLIDATNFTNSVRAYQAMLANDKDFLATRVSYKLNLTGPGVTVQTACSTGLVAVHLARQALLSGDCDMALAGGVAARVPHQAGYLYEEGMVFSPDGRCRAFDADAQGMVLGNGVGIVVLKRLADALADGDIIHAVIKGSAINNDGSGKVGYTAPGVEGQVRVITKAQTDGGVEPETITFVETHGTGTNLGDPIEVAALTEVFRAGTDKRGFCALGAVKNNIGHLDIAAGAAGLIKTVLALKHKTIPPTPGCRTPNPQLKLSESPFYINTRLQPWEPGETPRRAGVSSFGIGGTNAHIVLEEAEDLRFTILDLRFKNHLLPLSAKTPAALAELAQRYVEFLDAHHDLPLANICYTAQVGRVHFRHRLAVMAETHAAMHQKLAAFIAGDDVAGAFASQAQTDRPPQQTVENLAMRYVGGEDVVWDELYRDSSIPPQKVELPTYPFQRRRYWVDIPAKKVEPNPQTVDAEPWREWLYTVDWRYQPRFGLPPTYLPPPVQLCFGAFNTQVQQPAVQQHREAIAQLEGVSVDYILHTFANSGVIFEPGQLWLTEQIARQMDVRPEYRRLLGRLLNILEEAGVLSQNSEGWQAQNIPVTIAPQKRMQALTAQYAAVAGAELTLLARCGERLGQVMRGSKNPLELLFPGSDTGSVRQLYLEPQAKLLIDRIRQAVATAIQTLPPDRGVRILEIGGGTGSVTAALLPHLPPEQTEYVFTDISPLFIAKAQQNFSVFSFVRYNTLDIEQSPLEQGYKPHQIDIVIAANVLHATKDLSQTLTHVRQLLAPGGLLLLLEDTTPRRWADLTFGLTKGWWRFADTRTEHPLLNAAQWRQHLLQAGFRDVASQPEKPDLGQTLIIAHADEPFTKNEPPKHPVLIFADQHGFGAVLAEELRAQGEQPVLAYMGDIYQQVNTETFHIRPDTKEDYQQLLTAIQPAKHIIHLWSLDAETINATIDTLQTMLQQECNGVLRLVQTVAQLSTGELPSLWLVTKGVIACDGSRVDVSGLAQSPLWGMGKVIALEYPDLWGGLIDVQATSVDEAKRLWQEIEAQSSNHSNQTEDHIAFRYGKRYVARLRKKTVIGDKEIVTDKSPYLSISQSPTEATYLITGGLGYLGLQFATWLVDNGINHLALVGRSSPSPEAEAAIESLHKKIGHSGGVLRMLQADVADIGQMAGVFDACRQLPPLRGVIHAAGIAVHQKMQDMTPADIEAVFRAKVYGTWLLHELTKEMALQQFICFSSAGAVWGAEGQAHYDAACYFLGTFAHYRRALGLPALTINWGMVAGDRLDRNDYFRWLTKIGLQDIPVTQACQAVEHLLATDTPQAVVANMDWQTFKPIYEWRGTRPFLEKIETGINGPAARAEEIPPLYKIQTTSTDTERFERVAAYLQHEITALLRLPHPPDAQQGFFELGLDSLMTIELRNQIRKALGVDLPIDKLLKNDSVAALATLICTQLPAVDNSPTKTPPHTPEPAGAPTTHEPSPEEWIEVTI